MARWYLAQGAADAWVVPVVDEQGVKIPCTGAEPLSALVWPGGKREQSFAITPTWNDSNEGLTLVTIDAIMSSSLDPATYIVECTIVDAIGPRKYYVGWLDIKAVAADDVEPPSYCSYQDLLDIASWIPDLQTSTDQAGFARQRGKARSWLDEIILNRVQRTTQNYSNPTFAGMSLSIYQDQFPGQSVWMRQQLDADKLVIRDNIREVTAKKTLSLICGTQLGKAGEESYQALARKFARESEEMIRTMVVEISQGDSPYSTIPIHLGSSSLR